MRRPLLLLDVDGVLLAGSDRSDPRPDVARWLARLAMDFELVWATSWGERANRVLGPSLGLPRLPAVTFGDADWVLTPKLPGVRRYVGRRPCAWIDDQLRADAYAWAAARREPTLLLATSPIQGLERRHVEQALLFAAAVRGVSGSAKEGVPCPS